MVKAVMQRATAAPSMDALAEDPATNIDTKPKFGTARGMGVGPD